MDKRLNCLESVMKYDDGGIIVVTTETICGKSEDIDINHIKVRIYDVAKTSYSKVF